MASRSAHTDHHNSLCEFQADAICRIYKDMRVASLRFHWVVQDAKVNRDIYGGNLGGIVISNGKHDEQIHWLASVMISENAGQPLDEGGPVIAMNHFKLARRLARARICKHS